MVTTKIFTSDSKLFTFNCPLNHPIIFYWKYRALTKQILIKVFRENLKLVDPSEWYRYQSACLVHILLSINGKSIVHFITTYWNQGIGWFLTKKSTFHSWMRIHLEHIRQSVSVFRLFLISVFSNGTKAFIPVLQQDFCYRFLEQFLQDISVIWLSMNPDI